MVPLRIRLARVVRPHSATAARQARVVPALLVLAAQAWELAAPHLITLQGV